MDLAEARTMLVLYYSLEDLVRAIKDAKIQHHIIPELQEAEDTLLEEVKWRDNAEDICNNTFN